MHYRCSKCVQREPVSNDDPLRALHLYALGRARDGGLTPLRMKAVRLVLNAPPDDWTWNAHPQCGEASGRELRACPILTKDCRNKHWRYTELESEAIWRAAGPFRAESP